MDEILALHHHEVLTGTHMNTIVLQPDGWNHCTASLRDTVQPAP